VSKTTSAELFAAPPGHVVMDDGLAVEQVLTAVDELSRIRHDVRVHTLGSHQIVLPLTTAVPGPGRHAQPTRPRGAR
jgi:hypothetical protein